MQTTAEPSRLLGHLIDEVTILSGIAKANGAVISLNELATLTNTNLSEEEIRCWWEAIPELAGAYELKNGLIIQRVSDSSEKNRTTRDLEQIKRVRAVSYGRYAREFASLCNGKGTKLFAISGSTSYKTPAESDDLDIFFVTRPNDLWLLMTKSLLLARFLRIFRSDFPRICFSYAADQNFAEKEFALPRDALFARDALTTVVVHGQDYYRKLLKKSLWISNHFPRLYQHRTGLANFREVEEEESASPSARIFLNILLRVLVGNYIAFKSVILNMKLRKQRKFSSLFTAKIGLDHCIFESVHYSKLRTMYLTLNHGSRPTPPKETAQVQSR
jgi:hypothetical protein